MSARLREALAWILRQTPTVLVLATLAAVGAWGAVNKWELRSFSALWGEEKKKDDKDEEKKDPASLSLGEDGAQRAGLEHSPASQQPLQGHVEAPAVLAFDHHRHAHLAPRTTGTAWRILRHEGDPVKKGELLALIAAETVGTAKAEFLSARINHEVKLKTLERLHAAGDAVPERQVLEADLMLRTARVRLVNAQQALVNFGLPLRLEDLRNLTDDQVARKVRLLGLPALPSVAIGHREQERTSWRAEQSPYDVPEGDLPGNLLPLVAPFDGLVIRHDANIGEVVGPTQPVFLVADVRKLAVMMDVRQEDSLRLSPGQKVTFRATTTSQTASGRMQWVSAEVDPKTRTVRARAIIDNPTGRLRPATFGRAWVVVREDAAVLTVPDDALQWDGGFHRVFVRRDEDVYDPRIALVGGRSRGRTQLLDNRALQVAAAAGGFASPSGPLAAFVALPVNDRVLREVRPGEQVVTTGSHVLKSELLKARISGED
jgi:cobalt-zinc-cadmium efflux system membrane fusion protein